MSAARNCFPDLEANLAPYLPAARAAATLDIGCGTGRVLAYLLSKGYTNVLGVDIDEPAVKWASEHVTPCVECVSDLAKFLSKQRAAFDFIIAKDVVYYFPRPQLLPYLRAIGDALTPSGTLVVEVFNGAAFAGPLVKYKDYHIEWIFTEHSLRAVLEDAGFVVNHVVGGKMASKSMLGRALSLMQRVWQMGLRCAYFIERGRDSENPRILTKKLIALARSKG